jgi:hypothetical protein
LLAPLAALGQQLQIQAARHPPVYALGEPVVWNAQVSGPGAEGIQALHYSVKRDGKTVLADGVFDVTGELAGRASPWPGWYRQAAGNPQILETGRYFDALNFARYIKAPTLVAVGLIDDTARTAGVIAAYNQIPAATKQLVLMEYSDHHGSNGSQKDWGTRSALWLKALAQGNPPPM